MRKFKVLLDFAQYSASKKLIFLRNILLRLTNNPFFTTPDIPLADAKIALDLFEAAILAAQDGSHTAISAMHDNDKKVTLLFTNEAHYVDRIANGDETKILSSGFNISKQPVSIDKAVLTVRDGPNSGTVILDANSVPRSSAYVWKMAKGVLPADDSGYELITVTTQSTHTVEGLTPATYCYFIVAAVTPEGITDFCAPVMKLIN